MDSPLSPGTKLGRYEIHLQIGAGRVQFSFSRNGDLAYVEGRSDDSRDAGQPLIWVDRHGVEHGSMNSSGERLDRIVD